MSNSINAQIKYLVSEGYTIAEVKAEISEIFNLTPEAANKAWENWVCA